MIKKTCIYIIFYFTVCGCKEKFNANMPSPDAGYLVVEGFISSRQDPTSITLSRSVKLYDSIDIVYEQNAIVSVESENNETFPLYENASGVYTSAGMLTLNENEKYRVHIITRDNKEYASDFENVRHTPPLDSITWRRENGGLRIYVNTHDPQNNTKYYKWNYEETWEIHSAYLSTLEYVFDPFTNMVQGVAYRNPFTTEPDTTIYKCWQSHTSNSTDIGSSEKLTDDVIHLPLTFIDPGSEKLSVLYSIKVKQYALSHEAYLFYEKIKKNTEQLGSLFDPQPSELKGNIHCITNPSEQVVGFIFVSEQMNQRVFTSNADVGGWNYQSGCQITVVANDPSEIIASGFLYPTTPHTTMQLSIVDFNASDASCVDCTLKGTNIKPFFWP